jgi:hypothetical protein
MPVDIVIPATLPRPLADGHQYRPVDPALTVPKDQGELRRLPRYTAVPRQLALVWRFTQAEFDTFWDWYEDDVDAGARRFDVFVGRQGGGAIDGTAPGTWHTAQFVQPPQHEPLAGGRPSSPAARTAAAAAPTRGRSWTSCPAARTAAAGAGSPASAHPKRATWRWCGCNSPSHRSRQTRTSRRWRSPSCASTSPDTKTRTFLWH